MGASAGKFELAQQVQRVEAEPISAADPFWDGLLGGSFTVGDLYAALRTRSDEARKRFSTERDESKALLERKRCLKKLKKQLDIPDEVLMTLPSAGDIEDRTRRALEKAKRRDERSQSVKDKKPTTEDDWEI